MANPEHVKVVAKGATAISEWRDANPGVRLELGGAELGGADLEGANLRRADLTRADLEGADLRRAYLEGASLEAAELGGANLEGADLGGVNLRRAYLEGASLEAASLSRASLIVTRVSSASFGGARLKNTTLDDVDLSEAKGLEEVVHLGPSGITTRTTYKSKGKIPEAFLRGCGLADWEIENTKLYREGLTRDEYTTITYRSNGLRFGQAIQLHPVIISYTRVAGDQSLVEQIEAAFDDKGIRYWRDVHDMNAGDIEQQIERAFVSLDPVVLLVLSEHALASDWVEWEAQRARELEKELNRHVLCPIAIDDAWRSAKWPGKLRKQIERYNILDFSNWQDDAAFATAFDKLHDGLRDNYRVIE